MSCDPRTMTYDPSLIVISYQGQILRGFAQGTFVTARRDTEEWGKVIGVGGSSARYQTMDRSGTMEVTLAQNSSSNRDLSIIMNTQRALSSVDLVGATSGAFSIFDDIGNTLVFAAEAWILNPPTISYGQELTDRVWTFQTDNLEFLVSNAPEEETFNARLNLN